MAFTTATTTQRDHTLKMHSQSQAQMVTTLVQAPKYPAKLQSINAKQTTPKKSKVLLWGPPFWYLFHSIAEKVSETKFQLLRVELLNIIYLICQNLPCPDCTNHAITYLNNVNFKGIQTKHKLKEVLFTFHNSVNEKKGNPIFTREELGSKYETANINAIWKNFIMGFSKKHRTMNMISNDFHRENITKVLQTWFASNATHFDR